MATGGEQPGGGATPIMRQYRSVKERHPDTVLLFRMGDFYELFYDDAVLASRVLGLVLTSRDRQKENPVPMAGFPHHAVTGYTKKLLDAGYRVAVCEQLEEPGKGKAIVARDVVRIITPGANVETDLLEAGESNFLMALAPGAGGDEVAAAPAAVAYADISTGTMAALLAPDPSILAAELVRLAPKEVLVPPGDAALAAFVRERLPGAALTPWPPLRGGGPAFAEAVERIDSWTGRDPARGESCAALLGRRLAPVAASLLEYLARTQPGRPLPVKRIAVHAPSQFMVLDETSVLHLELVRSQSGEKKGSLLHLVDRTVTAMGSRLLRAWLLMPLMDVAAIRRRQDAVERFVDDGRTRGELRRLLGEVCDVERVVSRCIVGAATPRELGALRDTLGACPRIAACLGAQPDLAAGGAAPAAGGALPPLPPAPAGLAERLERALAPSPPAGAREGGIFARGWHEGLDELVYLSTSGKEAIAALEAAERAATGISSLKVKYNKVFGYFIEVTRTNLPQVPQDRFQRKQTIVGGERFVTGELKELEAKILTADERRKALEAELFGALVEEVAAREGELHALAAALAALDALAALAQLAAAGGWVRPLVDDGGVVAIREGRHPVVEAGLAGDAFVPNDVALDADGERVWIITGPNMSGKSTFMRQVALSVILAQAGSFIPAAAARVGVCDRIFTRVGASDNLSWGQSTFMVEMTETAAILGHATPRSLVVLDEIGRGTSTFDGMSIAWAVAEHLHNVVGCRTLLATHYHELTRLTETLPRAANYNVRAEEFGERIIFLRKVTRGGCSRSYGIQVAQLAGVPPEVIRRAKEILAQVETQKEREQEAAVRRRGGHAAAAREAAAQLDLFGGARREREKEERLAAALRETDVEKLTPLEALNLLARLKKET